MENFFVDLGEFVEDTDRTREITNLIFKGFVFIFFITIVVGEILKFFFDIFEFGSLLTDKILGFGEGFGSRGGLLQKDVAFVEKHSDSVGIGDVEIGQIAARATEDDNTTDERFFEEGMR